VAMLEDLRLMVFPEFIQWASTPHLVFSIRKRIFRSGYTLKYKPIIASEDAWVLIGHYSSLYSVMYVIEKFKEVIMYTPQHFGVFLGRMEPFHNGHNSVIQQIIRDGLTPVIILGGANKFDDRHPLNIVERNKLIQHIYPPHQVRVLAINDYDDWDEWYNEVIKVLDFALHDNSTYTIYSHEKSEDAKSFKFQGKVYENESHNILFTSNDIPVKLLPAYHDREGDVVSATQIRANEQYARNHLDARVYKQLKNLQWWV